MKPRAYPILAGVIAARGDSLGEVADAVDASYNTVQHVLSGRQRPSAALRARFAEHLGVDEDVLFQLAADVAQFIELAQARGLAHMVPAAGNAGETSLRSGEPQHVLGAEASHA